MNLLRTLAILQLCGLAVACSKPAGDVEDGIQDNGQGSVADTTQAEAPENPKAESVQLTPGLSMRVLREGNGAMAEAGQIAVVHYTGWLYDESAEGKRGTKFDSSVDRGQHFQFPLGAGRVIRGWDQGVVGMQQGEKRELTIAPAMAYGDRGAGSVIPPGATLIFEVELAEVHSVEPKVDLPAAPVTQ